MLALIAVATLSGCHSGIFLQDYTVAWKDASNDVRAWGDRNLARTIRAAKGDASTDVFSEEFSSPAGARLLQAARAVGYVRRTPKGWTFSADGLRASRPCPGPEPYPTCRNFIIGRLHVTGIDTYEYRSASIAGPMSRTLTFHFTVAPTTAFGRSTEAAGALDCDEGFKTTPSTALPGGTDSVALDATWTRTRSCLGFAGEAAWYGFPVIGPQTRNPFAARVPG
jgi:hypothetical protein